MLLWTWKRLLFVCSTEDTGLTKPVCWLGRFTGETCFLPLCVCVSQYVCVWFYVHSEHTALLFKDTQLSITGWITLSCTLNTLVHLSNRKGFIGGCPWCCTPSCLLLMYDKDAADTDQILHWSKRPTTWPAVNILLTVPSWEGTDHFVTWFFFLFGLCAWVDCGHN